MYGSEALYIAWHALVPAHSVMCHSFVSVQHNERWNIEMDVCLALMFLTSDAGLHVGEMVCDTLNVVRVVEY